MRIMPVIAFTAAAFAALGSSAPLDARTAKSKLQRADKAKPAPPLRRAAADRTSHRISTLQDRTTVNHPNGRLNGQALFESISERTSGAGE